MTYLITAGSGIGAQTARELALSATPASPVNVFFSSLTTDGCSELCEELRQLGASAEFLTGDLTTLDFAIQLVARCVACFGRLDSLFNVAGSSGRRFGDGPMHLCSEEGWAKTIEVNLTTQYRMCREALSVMRKQDERDGQRGCILNMSSILALHPEPTHFDTIAYAASKGAVLSMSRTMAASYAQERIRVNAVAPALVVTPMSARASQNADIVVFTKSRQSLTGGMMPVEDVAKACAFLLSPASRSITGQCVQVDGAWSLH